MNEALQAEAIIGDAAKKFIESELGQIVFGMAEQERQAAYVALSKANPAESETIRQLQNMVWRAESFSDWLTELITKGENAIDLLKAEAESE